MYSIKERSVWGKISSGAAFREDLSLSTLLSPMQNPTTGLLEKELSYVIDCQHVTQKEIHITYFTKF